MKYLIDTNIVIYYLNNEYEIVYRMKDMSNFCISTITVGELYYGLNNSSKKLENEIILENFLRNIEIVDINKKIAFHYGYIKSKLKKQGNLIPDNDIWIAAIAYNRNLVIATRDKHFQHIDFIHLEKW